LPQDDGDDAPGETPEPARPSPFAKLAELKKSR
jgi:hypothetical protein